MSRMRRLLGLEDTPKTREAIIDHVCRSATDNIHYILADITEDNRDKIINRVEVRLSPRKWGPELTKLHIDLCEGRGDDLVEALKSNKTLNIQGVYPLINGASDAMTIRVSFGVLQPRKVESPETGMISTI